MSTSSSYPARSKAAHTVAWILQIVLALAFLAAAGAKLAAVPAMVESFDQIGLGQGFRIVTALVEIVGAIALLAPGTTVLGALWLSATMVGATAAHLLRIHTSPAPALVLLALLLVVAWLRWPQVERLVARFR